MAARIALIDAHPDPDPARFIHALAARYQAGAEAAGHELRRIDLAGMDFPLLRSRHDWDARPPAAIAAAQDTLAWADHIVILYPLWLGDLPALLKGFLEQALRPGFAFKPDAGLNGGLLTGKSARVVVTMGMPGFFYEIYFRAHSVKSLERNVLKFVGIGPVSRSVIGAVDASADDRARWLDKMENFGRAGC
ncbi:MAG: NAD(P)H-dependent oxidoreductase [Pseudomonadota bacterium]